MEQTYVCVVCGHEHDEAVEGVWQDLPDDFLCPECGCGKDEYYVIWPAVNSLIYITTAPVDLELHNFGITEWKNP